MSFCVENNRLNITPTWFLRISEIKMADFEVAKFEENPSVEKLDLLKKTELWSVAEHFHLKVKQQMTKSEIKQVIVNHLVEKGFISPQEARPQEYQSELTEAVKLKQLELDYQLRLRELEIRAESEKEQRQCEEREKDRRHEMQLQSGSNLPSRTRFDVAKQVHLVPTFNEKEVDKYFLHFEKIAKSLEWPPDKWAFLLQTKLVGRAQEVFTSLPDEASADFRMVKTAIIQSYELVPEAYRQKFRFMKKEEKITFIEFARDKNMSFTRWIETSGADTYEKLKQLILLEDFKKSCVSDLRTYLEERRPATVHDAAVMADEYVLTHKRPPVNLHQRVPPKQSNFHQSNDTNAEGKEKKSDESEKENSSKSSITCAYCKKKGHQISDCWTLQRKNEKKNTSAFTTTKNAPVIHDLYLPFIFDGKVSLAKDRTTVRPVKILRDTGAVQTLVLDSILPFSEDSSLGMSALVGGIECGAVTAPLHDMFLTCDLITKPVVVGIRPKLPIDGVDILLGNDLVGDKVKPVPYLITSKIQPQCSDSNSRSDMKNTAVVTRGMKKAADEKTDSNSRSDMKNTAVVTRGMKKAADKKTDSNVVDLCDTWFDSETLSVISHVNACSLPELQKKDLELCDLYVDACAESDNENQQTCYYIKNDILMRKWRPTDAKPEDEWRVIHQIVLPQLCRSHVLKLAHDIPMSGHLGVNKTLDRIQNHFYWPGIRSDVSNYCKSCHTCQLVGKPNQKPQKAPLKPIPAFETPFSRVLVDCVGPLPKSKSGNQYLLTIMCASTRFPEAIPLRNITAKNIVKVLVKFFTLFGLPSSLQSDQGSNFMSTIFQQVMRQLGIQQIKSSAYHPESQGALERFHQTLKTMLKTFCFENEKDWDKEYRMCCSQPEKWCKNH